MGANDASNSPFQPADWQDFEAEKAEWLESLDSVFARHGRGGVAEILSALRNHTIRTGRANWDAALNTPYRNTIAPGDEPRYPGDIELETRIENINRWNAMAMVVRAADNGSGVGGHIATYASAATMLEVGFQHFFRAKSRDYGGDLVVVQPHACPGVYARAFLEGRLSEAQLINFRRELQAGGGLPSYPHPRALPDFWQMPCASMGLSTPMAIAQARFAKYLERRGLKTANGGRVWCFIGDGEADEPEVLGTINIASREGLDNLVLVVNCNLQRLDGPVRGNGKIIQELERSFRGADWNVLKVIWGGGWDGLFARDHDGVLLKRMEEALDGDYQQLSILQGGAQRELWVGSNEALAKLMDSLTDEEVRTIKRGGQDHKKLYAAFHQATHHAGGRPTVILVKTVKGDGMGKAGQGRNTAHQKKQLNEDERLAFAEHHNIPLPRDAVLRCDFFKPAEGSPELTYLHQQRRGLGGYLPQREVAVNALATPDIALFEDQLKGSGEREASTTMVSVRMLSRLMKDSALGKYVVPIVPDEARTFGMEGLFKEFGIYSPKGQQYTPVDSNSLQPYREAENGQLLQEGICEGGAISSFIAAGTAYAQHGVPMVPFYIFYSMFGFQRVGDFIWAAADMMCRGFLLGGTAGRTTLNGEGLQHQDGHSHLIAATVPACRAYDPAFGYELALIVRDGIRRMYAESETSFYYITVYNENAAQPATGDWQAIEQGVLKGLYRYRKSSVAPINAAKKAHLLGSGAIMSEVLSAATQLEGLGVAVDVWSVTSYTELSRNALDVAAANRASPLAPPTQCHVQQAFAGEAGVFVAASDYMKALPLLIAPWVPGRFEALGTDGFGVSEARPDLREHFQVDAASIVLATLAALVGEGALTADEYRRATAH